MNSASFEDIQATLLELSTNSITVALDTFTKQKASDVFVCGGGFYNTALIGALRNAMPSQEAFSQLKKIGYDLRFVEATAFLAGIHANKSLARKIGHIEKNEKVAVGGYTLLIKQRTKTRKLAVVVALGFLITN